MATPALTDYRRLMRIVLACLVVGSLIGGRVQAQATGYSAAGLGGLSCGSWTVARRDEIASPHQQWVLGFLSGLGSAGPRDPLQGMDAQGVWAWIDNYCQSHPIDRLTKAAEAFALAHPH